MRSIYGTRSIIPNNYYFTFDKIYKDEAVVKSSNGDSVLIGRAVLAQAEHTVWLKTNIGYIRVAKLDNEGRFLYSEGYVLQDNEDIDNLKSKGNTYNDDGTFIVDTKNHTIKGTFPRPTGISTTDNYKANSFFVLEQYSEEGFITAFKKLTTEVPTSTGFNNPNQDEAIEAQKQGAPLYKKEGKDIVFVEQVNLSITANEEYYIPYQIIVPTYQIIHDVTASWSDTSSGNKTLHKQDNNNNNGLNLKSYLNHIGKTFIRKGYSLYTLLNASSPNKDCYLYDLNIKKLINVGERNLTSSYCYYTKATTWWDSSKQFFDITNLSSWAAPSGTGIEVQSNHTFSFRLSPWVDESEHYTGYLGNLDATGFQHTDKPFDINYKNTNSESYLHQDRNNNVYVTVVDAINHLDRVIGSTNLRFGKTDKYEIDSTNDNGWTIATSSKLKGDKRLFNIREDNLADALIRHDADIGFIEDWNNTLTPNMYFYKDDHEELYTKTVKSGSENSKKTQINSLTDAVEFLDKMLGDYSLLDNDFGRRPVHVPPGKGTDDNFTFAEAVQHQNADIGQIEELTSTTYNEVVYPYNFYFDDTSKHSLSQIKASNLLIGTTKDDNHQIPANSLRDIVAILDKAIGKIGNLSSINSLNTYGNLVEALNHLNDEVVGDETSLSDVNQLKDDKGLHDTIIKALNYIDVNLIGEMYINGIHDYSGSTTSQRQNPLLDSPDVYTTTLVDIINRLDSYIGTMKGLSDTNSHNRNSIVEYLNDLNLITIGDLSGLHNTNSSSETNRQNNINPSEEEDDKLVWVLNTLDSLIGAFQALHQSNTFSENTNNLLSGNQSLVEVINDLDSLLGNLNKFKDSNNNTLGLSSFSNAIDAIIEIQKRLGAWSAADARTWTRKPDKGKDVYTPQTYTNLLDYLDNVDEWLKQLQDGKLDKSTFQNWIDLINNLAENMDILDANLTFIMEKIEDGTLGGGSGLPSTGGATLTWGTF